MRKFIHKIQDLSKKAVEINQALQGLPGKAAEARQAIVMSAGELQQIRNDIQGNLNGLKANTEDRLLLSMREINDATTTFEEAGYELTGMDLDLTLTQRLSVDLRKFEDVSHARLQSILARETKETIKSILSGIIKAEETAANIELSHLKMDGLVVHVGVIPLIRMCWRADTFADQTSTVETQPTATPAAPLTSTLPPPPPSSFTAYGAGSFFEQRSAPVVTPAPISNQPSAAGPPSAAESVPPVKTMVESGITTKAGALDRFKKMPNLSKRSG